MICTFGSLIDEYSLIDYTHAGVALERENYIIL